MITKMRKLGSLLFTVLSLFIVGGIVFLFTEHLSYVTLILLSSVIVFLGALFIGFIFYDNYVLRQKKYLQDLEEAMS